MFDFFLFSFASIMLFGNAVNPENTSPLLMSKIYGENSAFEPPKFPRGKIYQEIWQQIEVPKEAPNWINDLNDPLSEIPFQDYFPGPGEAIDSPSYVERTVQKIYELQFKNDNVPLIIGAIKFLYNQEKYNNPQEIKENNADVVAATTTTMRSTAEGGKRGKISAFEMDDESNPTTTPTKENKNVTNGNSNETMESTTFKPDQNNVSEENVKSNQTSTTHTNTVDKDEKHDEKDETHDVSTESPPIGGGGGGIGLPGVSVGGIVGRIFAAGTILGGAATGVSGTIAGVVSSVGSDAISSSAASSLSSSASNVVKSGRLGQNLKPKNQANSKTNSQANSRPKNQKNSNKNNNKNNNKKQKKDKKKQDKDDDDDDFDLDLDELEDLFPDDDTTIDEQSTAENISALFIEQFKRLDDACEMFKTNFTEDSDDLTEFQNKYSSMATEVEDIREKLGEKIDKESSDEIYNEKVKVFNEGYLLVGLLNIFYDNIASINSSLVAYVEAIENLQFDGYIFKYNITDILLGSESIRNKIHKDVEKVGTIVKKTHFRLVNCFGESSSTLQNWLTSIKSFYQTGVELGKKIFLALFEQQTFDTKSWSEAVVELKNFVESVEQPSNLSKSIIDLEQTTLDCIYNISNFLFKKQGPILTAIYNHTF